MAPLEDERRRADDCGVTTKSAFRSNGDPSITDTVPKGRVVWADGGAKQSRTELAVWRTALPYPRPEYPCTENPDGWFAVALSHEVAPGALHAVSALGQELIVFRTQSGEARVASAYCPHLGAHLGHGGIVRDDCVVCPFHNWSYAADGRCVDIPYADELPSRAKLRVYPTLERNGAILMWHHHAGHPPDFVVPQLPAEGWTDTRWTSFDVEMHIIDIGENGVDTGHFQVVHGTGRAGLELLDVQGPPFRYDLFTSYPGDGIGLPNTFVDVTTQWSMYCPGFFVAITAADQFPARSRQAFHFTPIPNGKVRFRVGISIDEATVPRELHEMVFEKNAELTRQNFDEDRTIWKYKTYRERPALCSGDVGLADLRRYFRRFYPELAARTPADAKRPDGLRLHEAHMLPRFTRARPISSPAEVHQSRAGARPSTTKVDP